MIKQNVNVVNFNSLYEILNEIKDDLSFNVIKHEKETDVINDKKNITEDSLIITSPNNKSLSGKNLLVLDDLPMPIVRLVELININLIKLKFNLQSKINIKDYILNLNSKFISKKEINLKLTEKEIEIILYLDKKKVKHSVLELQKNIWGYASDLETHTVETHIYRLRKKISDKFGDKNLIISSDEGYFIE
ncbi:winged helix-turn-helix domain-containing protein [Candidatus Pelagibacter bacterium]|nr:winged helix-turn-helix domain-containing protein [Candidatus Pelagibacter bacterium]|tara:strand:- start:1030 stop:1602 length:573 start_codon:yes stop_codon:yes gene_type:complete